MFEDKSIDCNRQDIYSACLLAVSKGESIPITFGVDVFKQKNLAPIYQDIYEKYGVESTILGRDECYGRFVLTVMEGKENLVQK